MWTIQWLASLRSGGGHDGLNSPQLIPEIGSRCREWSRGERIKLRQDFARTEMARSVTERAHVLLNISKGALNSHEGQS